MRRVFNNAKWEEGGRFYGGWWQTLPKKWRKRITILGFPTHEIDYSGLHIAILYAREGIDYWKNVGKDPYQIEGYEKSERMRKLLKLILLISVNAENKANAIKAGIEETPVPQEQPEEPQDPRGLLLIPPGRPR